MSNLERLLRYTDSGGVRLVAVACLVALLAVACGEDAEQVSSATTVEAGADAQSSSESPEDDGAAASTEDNDATAPTEDDGAAASSSSSDSDGAAASASDDDTVSFENPGAEGVPFDGSQNAALADATALQVVRWTVGPSISPGEVVAEGELEEGAVLFNPLDGEGSAFSVFYKGHTESMVELLPDLGPTQIWDTFSTVAATEIEIEGSQFRLRAYSPLFMDANPSDLELRVYGYDESGAAALLAVEDIGGQ